MSVAVIGGSGFLGSSLLKRLENAGLPVVNYDLVDSQISDTHILDVTNIEPLTLHGKTCIVNLAAVHRDDAPKEQYYEVNVGGAEQVCAEAERVGIDTIIFTSSVAVYGFAPPGTDETGEINYFNEYGKTKYLAEQVYLKWQSNEPKKRRLVIIRPTVIFGPGNRGNVYNLLNQIASRRFVMVGDGRNVKSMAYVENVAAFLTHLMSGVPGVEVFNYVDQPDLDMNSLVKISNDYLFGGGKRVLRMPKVLGYVVGYLFDILSFVTRKNFPISSVRVRKFLGTTQFTTIGCDNAFVAPFTLKDGLSQTLNFDFYPANSGQYDI